MFGHVKGCLHGCRPRQGGASRVSEWWNALLGRTHRDAQVGAGEVATRHSGRRGAASRQQLDEFHRERPVRGGFESRCGHRGAGRRAARGPLLSPACRARSLLPPLRDRPEDVAASREPLPSYLLASAPWRRDSASDADRRGAPCAADVPVARQRARVAELHRARRGAARAGSSRCARRTSRCSGGSDAPTVRVSEQRRSTTNALGAMSSRRVTTSHAIESSLSSNVVILRSSSVRPMATCQRPHDFAGVDRTTLYRLMERHGLQRDAVVSPNL
jgi:hypothetical protein